MKLSNILAVLAIACLTVPASAGRKSPSYGVVVNLSGRTANGTLGPVHNSSNNVESIYCSIIGYETATGVSCAAVSAANVFAACNITNPPRPMLDALSTMGPDSNISFAWSSTYKCTSISVLTSSDAAAKIPPPPPTVLGGVL
jgi:hypothetical protein